MYSTDRQSHRRVFAEAWRKASSAEPLTALEAQIVDVIRRHPEYQPLLEPGAGLDRDYPEIDGSTNPFMHLALHLAVLEQTTLDRPQGMRAIYQGLAKAVGDPHQADHAIMDCILGALVLAQQSGQAPSESAFLECIETLERRHLGHRD